MIFKKNYSFNNLSVKLTIENDINELKKYSLKKKFYKYLEYNTFKKKDAESYFKKKINSKKIIFFTIFFKNKIVGTFSINNYKIKKKECMIGYGINPSFWGKGIFTKLVKLIIKKIFIKKNQKVNVITRDDNYPSIACLIKNNFKIKKKLNKFYYDKKTKKKYDALKLQWIKN